jgi:hypothetical protein
MMMMRVVEDGLVENIKLRWDLATIHLCDLMSCLNHSPWILLDQLIVRLFSDCRS